MVLYLCCPGGVSAIHINSEVFTEVFCLYIDASWSTCEKDEVKNDLWPHLDNATRNQHYCTYTNILFDQAQHRYNLLFVCFPIFINQLFYLDGLNLEHGSGLKEKFDILCFTNFKMHILSQAAQNIKVIFISLLIVS